MTKTETLLVLLTILVSGYFCLVALCRCFAGGKAADGKVRREVRRKPFDGKGSAA